MQRHATGSYIQSDLLLLACAKGDTAAVVLLLASSEPPAPNAPDVLGRTPMFYAKLLGHHAIVSAFGRAGYKAMPGAALFGSASERARFWDWCRREARGAYVILGRPCYRKVSVLHRARPGGKPSLNTADVIEGSLGRGPLKLAVQRGGSSAVKDEHEDEDEDEDEWSSGGFRCGCGHEEMVALQSIAALYDAWVLGSEIPSHSARLVLDTGSDEWSFVASGCGSEVGDAASSAAGSTVVCGLCEPTDDTDDWVLLRAAKEPLTKAEAAVAAPWSSPLATLAVIAATTQI